MGMSIPVPGYNRQKVSPVLCKQGVAGSNPIFRSTSQIRKSPLTAYRGAISFGQVADKVADEVLIRLFQFFSPRIVLSLFSVRPL